MEDLTCWEDGCRRDAVFCSGFLAKISWVGYDTITSCGRSVQSVPKCLAAGRWGRGFSVAASPCAAEAAPDGHRPPGSPTQRHPEAGALQKSHRPQCLQPCREPDPHPTFKDTPAEGEGSEGGRAIHITPAGLASARLMLWLTPALCLSWQLLDISELDMVGAGREAKRRRKTLGACLDLPSGPAQGVALGLGPAPPGSWPVEAAS